MQAQDKHLACPDFFFAQGKMFYAKLFSWTT